jgi:hypothetical protein
MYTEITRCRICGNPELAPILNLGNQYLTGVFPKSKSEQISSGPLELVKCCVGKEGSACGLVQLNHSFNLNEMYGDNYGYRSGLNQSMVNHLHGMVEKIQNMIDLDSGDLVIDIGSNDSTLLQGYGKSDCLLVGVDPTGNKFRQYYPDHITLISDFFSSTAVRAHFGDKKAKVITSIAMFYDLESPIDFMKEIYDILADDGIWVFEQSYMPEMLAMNAYDTICHEHLEYYALKQIKWMCDMVELKIIDIELNNVNGGSFSVTVAKKESPYRESGPTIEKILNGEQEAGFDGLKPFEKFKDNIYKHREMLIDFVKKIRLEKRSLLGYGASTKGNVILQFCNFTEREIPFIAEVNRDKFGRYTPGTFIPIISEEDARRMKPDYFLVLPWHFKENLLIRERDYLVSGGKMVFPLPSLEIV